MSLREEAGSYTRSRSEVNENWSEAKVQKMFNDHSNSDSEISDANSIPNNRSAWDLEWPSHISRRSELENRMHL